MPLDPTVDQRARKAAQEIVRASVKAGYLPLTANDMGIQYIAESKIAEAMGRLMVDGLLVLNTSANADG